MPKSKIAHRMSVRVGFKDGALELVVINKDTNQIMCERIPIDFSTETKNAESIEEEQQESSKEEVTSDGN